MPKRYDRAYFERWYRGESRVSTPSDVRRKVSLAISISEYFLRRKIRSVLDVACGEGAWLPHLRALRPGIRYQGVDPSSYAVRRYGQSRNIVRGGLGDVAALRLASEYDLIVCADALHYVGDDEIRSGIAALAGLCGGIAYFEVLTSEDDIIGDLEGLIQRPARWYRDTFSGAGFVAAGPYSWLSPRISDDASALEATR
jgi:SAM-dependent methyltransferase